MESVRGVRFCKKRYLSLNTSLKDIFPGGFGEVAQQVFHRFLQKHSLAQIHISPAKISFWVREVFKDIVQAYRNAPQLEVREGDVGWGGRGAETDGNGGLDG